jgi:predicted kinase
MIFNLRGTSGSGKSTLVRNLTALYGSRTVFRREGRKQPLGYVYSRGERGRSLAVVGHYETACGGCDTIASMDDIFDLVRQSAAAGHDVIFEGLLISADVNRTVDLHKWAQEQGIEMGVIALDTPLDVCIDSINIRRRAKDPNKPDVATKNTESKFKGVKKSVERLLEAGVPARWESRDSALAYLQQELAL